MNNKYKNGAKVIVYGYGKNNGKFYENVPAIVIERDSYFQDYNVQFADGTTDWISPEYLRKPYIRKRRKKI